VFSALSGEGFEAYDDPGLLAAAFGRHWDEALVIVSGDQAKRGEARRLATFVGELGLERAQAILLEEGDDEARLVSLRLALDPQCEPVFRDVDLSGDGLQRLAAGAARSDGGTNAATCAALLDARVLSAHAAQSAHREWATIDAQWLTCDRYAFQQLARLRPLASLPELDDAGRATIRAQLLNAIIDKETGQRLREAAQSARKDRHARTRGWFNELADHQPAAHDALGHDLILTLLQPAAEEQATKEKRDEKEREQQQRLQEALDALPAMPMPPPLNEYRRGPTLSGSVPRIIGWTAGLFLPCFWVVNALSARGGNVGYSDPGGAFALALFLGVVAGMWGYLKEESRLARARESHASAVSAAQARDTERVRVRLEFMKPTPDVPETSRTSDE
jgi:hypothetical protein